MAIKAISDIDKSDYIGSNDLLVMEQGGKARSITGQTLLRELAESLDGHGDINAANVQLISGNHAPGTDDTYRVTLGNGNRFDFTVHNGVDGKGAVASVNGVYPDAAGNVEVLTVNPNLLDNWYFAYPVNQRGQSSYKTEGYSIDRWYKRSSILQLDVVSGGVRLSTTEAANICFLTQRLESPGAILGKTVTISALLRDIDIENGIRIELDFANGANVNTSQVLRSDYVTSGRNVLITATGTIPASLGEYTGINFAVLLANGSTAASATLVAQKLEIGERQTLCHKQGNTWVLNEIPRYADMLLACQRYYVATPGGYYCGVITSAAKQYQITVPVPVQMRTKPSMIGSPVMVVRTSNGYSKKYNNTARLSVNPTVTNIGAGTVRMTVFEDNAVDDNNIVIAAELIDFALSADL